jgi:hypothetical protein
MARQASVSVATRLAAGTEEHRWRLTLLLSPGSDRDVSATATSDDQRSRRTTPSALPQALAKASVRRSLSDTLGVVG